MLDGGRANAPLVVAKSAKLVVQIAIFRCTAWVMPPPMVVSGKLWFDLTLLEGLLTQCPVERLGELLTLFVTQAPTHLYRSPVGSYQ